MLIRFKFNPQKSIAAMAYLAEKLGPVDKVKLMKLLYIADRTHFLKVGHPITGDTQYAMPYGPVPSNSLKILDGESQIDPKDIAKFLLIKGKIVSAAKGSTTNAIDQAERDVLDQVVRSHGSAPSWDLVDHTHKFQEYERVYVKDTSRPIPYEVMLEIYKNDNRFRNGLPVVSEETLEFMECPFPVGADTDL